MPNCETKHNSASIGLSGRGEERCISDLRYNFTAAKQKRPSNMLERFWRRRGWDLNPRGGDPTRFRDARTQPDYATSPYVSILKLQCAARRLLYIIGVIRRAAVNFRIESIYLVKLLDRVKIVSCTRVFVQFSSAWGCNSTVGRTVPGTGQAHILCRAMHCPVPGTVVKPLVLYLRPRPRTHQVARRVKMDAFRCTHDL